MENNNNESQYLIRNTVDKQENYRLRIIYPMKLSFNESENIAINLHTYIYTHTYTYTHIYVLVYIYFPSLMHFYNHLTV